MYMYFSEEKCLPENKKDTCGVDIPLDFKYKSGTAEECPEQQETSKCLWLDDYGWL